LFSFSGFHSLQLLFLSELYLFKEFNNMSIGNVVVVVDVVGDQGPETSLRFALQPFGVLYTLFFPEAPTVAARCLHVLRDARDPSSERWNFNGRERVAENFA
jgi:hypothetical protein